MESLGDLIREAREERGLSIEQAERETKILKSYLNAIEMEDFSNFPGETYIVGFIRNYSEFLGLDPDALVQMYRNLVIQGQPVPLEALVTSSKKINKKKLYLGLAVVIGVVVVVSLTILTTFLLVQRKENSGILLQERGANTYEFNSTRLLFELELKDSIAMTEAVSGEDFIITFDGSNSSEGVIWLKIAGSKGNEEHILEVKKEDFVLVDLNKDEINDIKISFLDISRSGKISLELDRAFIDTPRLLLKDSLFTENFYKQNKMDEADSIVMLSPELQPIQLKLESDYSNWISYRADGGKTAEFELNKGKPLSLALRAGAIFWISNGNLLKVWVGENLVALPKLEDPSLAFVLCWKQLPAEGGYELGYYLLDN